MTHTPRHYYLSSMHVTQPDLYTAYRILDKKSSYLSQLLRHACMHACERTRTYLHIHIISVTDHSIPLTASAYILSRIVESYSISVTPNRWSCKVWIYEDEKDGKFLLDRPPWQEWQKCYLQSLHNPPDFFFPLTVKRGGQNRGRRWGNNNYLNEDAYYPICTYMSFLS